MKKPLIAFLVFVLVISAGIVLAEQQTAPAPASPAQAAPVSAPAASVPAGKSDAAAAPSLNISRMDIAGAVENRAPVSIAASFPADQDKVFCYVELKDVPKDTTITFVWTFGQNEMGKVTQQVKKSTRWRTWSSKSTGGLKGEWKVDVLDESGAVLKSATFKIG